MLIPHHIKYEKTLYRVMGRGRGRLTIFHAERKAKDFEVELALEHHRCGCVIHSYCLMGINTINRRRHPRRISD